MTLNLNPPPLEIPSDFIEDDEKRGFFSSLVRTFYQLWNEVRKLQFYEKALTTDATATAAQLYAVPENKTVFIEATIVARRTGGSAGTNGDSAWYKLYGGIKNIGGVLSLVGSVIVDGGEDQAAWSASLSSSGTNAVLTVTGAANNNITWETWMSAYEVGV